MPYYPEGSTPLLPTLAGLASAYFKIKNDNQELKNQQQQNQNEQQRIAIEKATAQQQYGLDENMKPQNTPIASPDTPSTPQSPGLGSFTPGKNGKTGAFQPPTDQPKGPLSGLQEGSPEYFMAKASFYEKQEASAPSAYMRSTYHSLAEEARQDANTASYLPGRETQGALHTAQTQNYGARTQLTEAQTKNASGLFAHQIDMLHERGATSEQIARIHAAYRKAGGGTGRGSNAAAVEQRAEYAAINAAAREGVNSENLLNNSIYRTETEAHDLDPTTYPNQPQAPTIIPMPVSVPGPNGQPITIMVGPQGVVHPQAAPPRATPGRATSSRPPPRQAAQPRPQPQQPESSKNAFQQGVDAIGHRLFGGGTPRITQKNQRTGEYRHSDDGGKTWAPGP